MKSNNSNLKSIGGKRCLTRCYPKMDHYLHPVLLTGVYDNHRATCAVEPVHNKNVDEGVGAIFGTSLVDVCKLEDNELYKLPDELESVLLSFYFNPRDFLASVYELNSFNDVIYWTLDNSYLPIKTIRRVHNCAWKAYGTKEDEISGLVVEYYYQLAKDNWFKDYMKVIDRDFSFDLNKTDNKLPSSKIEYLSETEINKNLRDTILQKYFTYDFFLSIIRAYISENRERWDNIDSFYGEIKNFAFDELLKILKTK